MTDWLARIDVDGNFLAAYRAKRAAVVAVSAAYVAFWAWLAFVIGFAAVFVLVNSGATSSNNWNAPSGVTPALAIGALCAVVAEHETGVERPSFERQAMGTVGERPAHLVREAVQRRRGAPSDDVVDCEPARDVARVEPRRVGGADDGNFSTNGYRLTYSSQTPLLEYVNYTSPTAVESNPSLDGRNLWPSWRVFWVKFEWAGTDKRFHYSVDGVNWIRWDSVSFGSYNTPSQFGIFIDPLNNFQKISMSLIHWEES